jgi:hypothetical protein
MPRPLGSTTSLSPGLEGGFAGCLERLVCGLPVIARADGVHLSSGGDAGRERLRLLGRFAHSQQEGITRTKAEDRCRWASFGSRCDNGNKAVEDSTETSLRAAVARGRRAYPCRSPLAGRPRQIGGRHRSLAEGAASQQRTAPVVWERSKPIGRIPAPICGRTVNSGRAAEEAPHERTKRLAHPRLRGSRRAPQPGRGAPRFSHALGAQSAKAMRLTAPWKNPV